MKRDLREMIGNQQILNSPPPHSLVYSIFVDLTYVQHFYTYVQHFDCLFLTIYQRFHLLVGFIFDKLAPPLDICFKRCFKSLSSSLQCIQQSQSAKNVVFFPFCFLIDTSMGGGL